MNLYAYVHNDPMSFTDPSGMSSCYSATHGFGTVCAGPALLEGMKGEEPASSTQSGNGVIGYDANGIPVFRSEERRVGKESGYGGATLDSTDRYGGNVSDGECRVA